MSRFNWDRVARESKHRAAIDAHERFLEALVHAEERSHASSRSSDGPPNLEHLLRRRRLQAVQSRDWGAFSSEVSATLGRLAHDRTLVLSGSHRPHHLVAGWFGNGFFLAVPEEATYGHVNYLRAEDFRLSESLPVSGLWWIKAFDADDLPHVGEQIREICAHVWGVDEPKRLRFATELLRE